MILLKYWTQYASKFGTLSNGHRTGKGQFSFQSQRKWKWSLSVVSNSLWPVDCSPPSSSVHGILQARILQYVAISFSRASSWPKNQTRVSCIAHGFFTNWAMREAHIDMWYLLLYLNINYHIITYLLKLFWSKDHHLSLAIIQGISHWFSMSILCPLKFILRILAR